MRDVKRQAEERACCSQEAVGKGADASAVAGRCQFSHWGVEGQEGHI